MCADEDGSGVDIVTLSRRKPKCPAVNSDACASGSVQQRAVRERQPSKWFPAASIQRWTWLYAEVNDTEHG